MSISGYKELSAQLKALGSAVGGSALRSAANAAMTPAVEAATAAAPVANPPYNYGNRTVDPYPKKTYKGRRVAPGFTSRSIVKNTKLDKTRTFVKVSLGVRREAFYAVQFLELGTSKIPKRPWLEPAFRGAKDAVDKRFRELLKLRTDAAARRQQRAVARELATPL